MKRLLLFPVVLCAILLGFAEVDVHTQGPFAAIVTQALQQLGLLNGGYANGQCPVWNSTTGKFAPGACAGGGSGTVTSVSVVSANGLAGTVATATTTPAITVSTSITGMLKGNGTAISAGVAGTDYVAPSTTVAGHALSSNVSIACADLSNGAASCSTDTTNASNISSGTLAGARLPNPSASVLGGVESITSAAHNWIAYIDTSGVPHQSQPTCGDLNNAVNSCSVDATNASNISSGTLAGARLPNPSSSVLGGIESIAAVAHQWINTISTSGVPNLTQPAFTDISGSVAAAQLPNPSSSTLGGVQSIAAVSHNFLTAISTSGVPAQAQPACGDLSNAAASCSTDTTNGSNISSGTVSNARIINNKGSLGITIDGAGSVITTGTKGFLYVPNACTISASTLLSTDNAVTSGSIVIDVWKAAYGSYPPTVGNTITASALPTLSSTTKAQDLTLTGWTTSVSAGDVLAFHVNSATTVTRVTLILSCNPS